MGLFSYFRSQQFISEKTGLILFLVTLFILPAISQAQKRDTTIRAEKKDRDPRPRRAALRSAILPGWGQVYNKKYWKVPILYAGGTTIALFYASNQKSYLEYKDLAKENPSVPAYRTIRDQYREWRDWNIVMFIGLYALQIIDANVDAHLREFDVGEDLAFSIKPYLCPVRYSGRPEPVTGISLNLRFKK